MQVKLTNHSSRMSLRGTYEWDDSVALMAPLLGGFKETRAGAGAWLQPSWGEGEGCREFFRSRETRWINDKYVQIWSQKKIIKIQTFEVVIFIGFNGCKLFLDDLSWIVNWTYWDLFNAKNVLSHIIHLLKTRSIYTISPMKECIELGEAIGHSFTASKSSEPGVSWHFKFSTGLQDFPISCTHFINLNAYSYLLPFFLRFFALSHSCCSHAHVLGQHSCKVPHFLPHVLHYRFVSRVRLCFCPAALPNHTLNKIIVKLCTLQIFWKYYICDI